MYCIYVNENREKENEAADGADRFITNSEGFYPTTQIQINIHWFVQSE